ncbi:Fe-S cluster assembly ATPase SufC [Candidatus Bipolaricaulota bacterium]|nr:Fe-S cluster assembly ATPase SufC [Candidatus Bipolaricaulota bacterium]
MLEVKDLGVKKGGGSILQNLNFSAGKSELHVVMGPNGSGKSTLARTLAGHPEYNDYEGSIKFRDREISDLKADERLREGFMMGFQHPPRINGVNIKRFLTRVLEKLDGVEGTEKIEEKIEIVTKELGFSEDLLARNINAGLSGGERKRLELLQARLLEPEILILDEPDSGVDVDSLELISDQINWLHERGTTIVLITHYGNLLEEIDLEDARVHLFRDGKIVTSGEGDLAREVEEKGFNRIYEECGCN